MQTDGSIFTTGTITRKYYSFAGQMIAMSECGPQGCGSGLQYFLTDHLGSVVAVANASGGLVSQQRYMPFGEVRTDVGTITQTDFGYTGQRNLDAQGNSFSTGLMDYKARFYDPALARFISPDTITPGGPQGLNRYAYSLNNPINFNDPSGHMTCEDVDENGNCDAVTKDDLTNLVKLTYGWELEGVWTMYKINRLIKFASDFATDVFNLTGKDGTTWIRNHVGNAVLHMGPFSDWFQKQKMVNAYGMVPTNINVLLPTDFTSTDYGEYTLIHEMGHVLDNNVQKGFLPATIFGGGPADAMVTAMGGSPDDCIPRFRCGDHQWYVKNVAGNYPWPIKDYANNGVADDFADTFAYSLMGNIALNGDTPPQRQIWMMDFLGLLP